MENTELEVFKKEVNISINRVKKYKSQMEIIDIYLSDFPTNHSIATNIVISIMSVLIASLGLYFSISFTNELTILRVGTGIIILTIIMRFIKWFLSEVTLKDNLIIEKKKFLREEKLKLIEKNEKGGLIYNIFK